jgi:hypothetical protein
VWGGVGPTKLMGEGGMGSDIRGNRGRGAGADVSARGEATGGQTLVACVTAFCLARSS